MCMRQNSWLCSIRFAKDLLDLHSIKVSVCWKPQRVILVDPATCHCNGNQSLFIMRFIITYTVPHHHLYGTASSLKPHRTAPSFTPHHTPNHHPSHHNPNHHPSHHTTPTTSHHQTNKPSMTSKKRQPLSSLFFQIAVYIHISSLISLITPILLMTFFQ